MTTRSGTAGLFGTNHKSAVHGTAVVPGQTQQGVVASVAVPAEGDGGRDSPSGSFIEHLIRQRDDPDARVSGLRE